MPMMNWAVDRPAGALDSARPGTGKENMDIDWHFRRGQSVRSGW